MTIYRVPIAIDTPRFTQRTAFEGTDYVLTFDYNGRQDRWYMSIDDADGNPIIEGLAIVTGVPLLSRFQDSRLPLGVLAAVDFTNNGGDPGYQDLYNRIRLTYYDTDEL